MEIQCQCGKFRARLKAFPNGTPGRLVCYCDDCQSYLRHLKRTDLLDAQAGTGVFPANAREGDPPQGKDPVKSPRLSPGGLYRFSTACCNTPIANLRPGAPWAGFLRCVYTAGGDAQALDQQLGPVRSRLMGQFAKGTPPAGTPSKFDLKALRSVMPFMLKGMLLGKAKPCPFFADDGVTPIVAPHVLTKAERLALR